MKKFTVLTGVAAPLVVPNVNTDVLIRIERMIDLGKGQLGSYCFEAWRYHEDGTENSGFVLNQTAYRNAVMLLGGANFGCGSSREPAVWALMDMGFRCVIAPSFGDIFFNNCFQNGMLPVTLPAGIIAGLEQEAIANDAGDFTVDLVRQRIVTPGGQSVPFEIDGPKRMALMEGLDEILMTLKLSEEVSSYQTRDRLARPWIYDFHP
jgi:3-isopropylmalate/(R)-2-methylmalate dehydratase small subunit